MGAQLELPKRPIRPINLREGKAFPIEAGDVGVLTGDVFIRVDPHSIDRAWSEGVRKLVTFGVFDCACLAMIDLDTGSAVLGHVPSNALGILERAEAAVAPQYEVAGVMRTENTNPITFGAVRDFVDRHSKPDGLRQELRLKSPASFGINPDGSVFEPHVVR